MDDHRQLTTHRLMLTKEQFIAKLPTSELFQSYVAHCNGDIDAGYELYVQRFNRWNSGPNLSITNSSVPKLINADTTPNSNCQ